MSAIADFQQITDRGSAMSRQRSDDEDRGLDRFGLTQRQAGQLVENLVQSTPVSRRLIVNALRQLGRPAVRILGQKLTDPNVEARQAAADALRQFSDPSDAIEPLLAALRDSDWLVRIWCADALGRVSVRDERVNRALREAKENDPLVYVRLTAESSLRRIGGPFQ